MAKPRDIAPIRSIATLQLITISISHSLSHRKRQASPSKNVAAIDRSNERVNEAQDVGSVLCVGEMDAGSQDDEEREGLQSARGASNNMPTHPHIPNEVLH